MERFISVAPKALRRVPDRAVTFNPNSAWAWAARGYVLVLRNRPELAIDAFQRAMRLSPLDPQTYYFAGGIAFACLYMGRFEEAVEWADRSFDQEPRFTSVLRLKLVACAQLGRIAEARQCLRQVLDSTRTDDHAIEGLSGDVCYAGDPECLDRRLPQSRAARRMTAIRRLAAILAADDAIVFLDAAPENEIQDPGLRRKIRDFAIAVASNHENSAAISGRLDSR
jgi:tetratricopeptide (TPR) repeat protein